MSLSHDEIESFLALSQEKGSFTAYAIRNLVNGIRLKPEHDSSRCYWILYSAACNGDLVSCRMFIRDWTDPFSLPLANITKFRPGKHYHVLGERFSSYSQAESYAKGLGYRPGSLEYIEAKFEGD